MTLDEIFALPTFDEQHQAIRAIMHGDDKAAYSALCNDPRYIRWLADNHDAIMEAARKRWRDQIWALEQVKTEAAFEACRLLVKAYEAHTNALANSLFDLRPALEAARRALGLKEE